MDLTNNPDVPPQRLIEHPSARAGPLLPRGSERFTVAHRTIQEHLAACYCTRQDDSPSSLVRDALKDPNRWREVLCLATARTARTGAQAGGCCKRADAVNVSVGDNTPVAR